MAELNTGRKETEKSAKFAEGGKTHMFGAQKAGEEKPGTTAHDVGSGGSDKFASGGKGKMFGYTGALPAQAGKTSAR
jgi:hypothetical protein